MALRVFLQIQYDKLKSKERISNGKYKSWIITMKYIFYVFFCIREKNSDKQSCRVLGDRKET